jgi:hypothetical protein
MDFPPTTLLQWDILETRKVEEFLSLMKEHLLVTKGRVLGATGYIQANLEFNASDS